MAYNVNKESTAGPDKWRHRKLGPQAQNIDAILSASLSTLCALFRTDYSFLTVSAHALPLDPGHWGPALGPTPQGPDALEGLPQASLRSLQFLEPARSSSAILSGLGQVLCGLCFSLRGLLFRSLMKYRPYPTVTSSPIYKSPFQLHLPVPCVTTH